MRCRDHCRAVRGPGESCAYAVKCLLKRDYYPERIRGYCRDGQPECCGFAACSLDTHWDAFGATHQTGAGEALEKQTINRNLVASLDYTFNENWGVTVIAPVVNRSHSHELYDTLETEFWDFTRLGDVKVLGRYQFPIRAFEHQAFGIRFGLKLPTGATRVANSEGTVAERALQPGTGSTDTLLGFYYHEMPQGKLSGWFAQALWEHPVTIHDGFKPGDQITADAGLSYTFSNRWAAQVQLNFLSKGRDTGPNAETDLSRGRYVYVSPGLTYNLVKDTQVYGFVQKPIYQYVNGVQLTSNWSAVLGLRQRF